MPDFFGETRLGQIGKVRLPGGRSAFFIRRCPQIVANIRDAGENFRL